MMKNLLDKLFFNNGFQLTYGWGESTQYHILFAVTFSYKPTVITGIESKQSGNTWLLQPTLQDVALTNCYVYMGGNGNVLDAQNNDYIIHMVALGV